MEAFFEFAGHNPILTFLLVGMLSSLLFKSWNRLLRCLNIRKHGWPPPYCDADGDSIQPAESE